MVWYGIKIRLALLNHGLFQQSSKRRKEARQSERSKPRVQRQMRPALYIYLAIVVSLEQQVVITSTTAEYTRTLDI